MMTAVNDDLREALHARWTADLSGVPAPAEAVDTAFAKVVWRYDKPHRHYHTLTHVSSVLDVIDELEPRNGSPSPTRMAGWLHDVIYNPFRYDNEANSADYSRKLFGDLGLTGVVLYETARLIELTAGHKVADGDRAGAILADADLSILGAAPDIYDGYARAVRAEYSIVTEELFRTARADVLDGFLARPRLYYTDTMYERLEAAARANLTRERHALSADN
jgi:predicted metal-dependent HD superfamily phosphohydrolase